MLPVIWFHWQLDAVGLVHNPVKSGTTTAVKQDCCPWGTAQGKHPNNISTGWLLSPVEWKAVSVSAWLGLAHQLKLGLNPMSGGPAHVS